MAIDLRTACVAHWKMNDNAASTTVVDSSGNGYHGTAQQNTSALTTDGKVGGALTFNGTTDYIDTGNSFQSTFSDSFTFNIWCKPNVDGLVGIIGTMDDIDEDNTEAQLAFNNLSELNFVYGDSILSNSIRSDNAIYSIPNTQWYMITGVMTKLSPTTRKTAIYCNGILLKESDIITGGTNFVSAYNVFIGTINEGGQLYIPMFAGSLDDVRIFNKALSTDEIAFLYNSGAGTEDLFEPEGISDYE